LNSVLQGKKVAIGLGVGVGSGSKVGEDDGRGETVGLGVGVGVGIGVAACEDDFWSRQTDFLFFLTQVNVLLPSFFTEPTFLHDSPD
jgi:hypothetical protein